MSAYLSPVGNEPAIDANGNPISGGKWWTYLAGTSTPAATNTDSTSGVALSNPIILNSRGMPTTNGVTPATVWIPGGTSLKFILTDSADVPIAPTFDNITGVNDPAAVSTQDQWVPLGITPTYISAVSFSVPGDQTNILQVNRRLKTANTGGTTYSTISAASFGAGITTVTVLNTSGVLDSGLSAVSYGLLSATNPSVPQQKISGTLQAATAGTSLDFTGLPPGVKRITVQLVGVSTSNNSPLMVQIGDAGGIETTGYLGAVSQLPNAAAIVSTNFTTGFGVVAANQSTSVMHGTVTLTLVDAATNTWVAATAIGFSDSAQAHVGGGSKSLSAVLDRARLTTVGGVNTFDLGSVNILYE